MISLNRVIMVRKVGLKDMKKGKVIVIEGACDGIGKTTQYQLLKKQLKKDGKEVVCHHFPSYGMYQAMAVEKYLNGDFGSVETLSPYFVNSLYATDRAITWYSELEKEYAQGKTILLDRYTTSSLIYQAASFATNEEKKAFIDYIIDFEYNKIGLPKPDVVIFLTAPFTLAMKMKQQRKENEGLENDIHERNLDFMQKVYDNACFVADYLDWEKIVCNKDDEMRSIEDIHQEVYQLVKKK